MLDGQAGAGMHESGVTRGDRDRDTCRDQRTLPRSERGRVRRMQVESSIAGMGIPGERERRVESFDLEHWRWGVLVSTTHTDRLGARGVPIEDTTRREEPFARFAMVHDR